MTTAAAEKVTVGPAASSLEQPSSGKEAEKHTPPTCPQCGSLLSAVTWECVRGPYCKAAKTAALSKAMQP
jgi:NAD-dependent DNA ligase